MSDFQKIKKDPRGRRWCPPQDTPNFKTLYIIYLCAPGGGKGHLAASWRGAPGSPKPSCLFSHFISSNIFPLQAPTAATAAAPPPTVQAAGWAINVRGAESRPHPPSVVVGLLLCLAKPLEESCDRFQGHSLALLLSWVLAILPAVEGILLDHVLVIQGIKERSKQVCEQAVQQLGGRLSTATPPHPTPRATAHHTAYVCLELPGIRQDAELTARDWCV